MLDACLSEVNSREGLKFVQEYKYGKRALDEMLIAKKRQQRTMIRQFEGLLDHTQQSVCTENEYRQINLMGSSGKNITLLAKRF